MKYPAFIFLFLCLAFIGFTGESTLQKSETKSQSRENIFIDPIIRQIYDLQNQRNTTGLIPFLSSENPRYREYTAIALASVQSPESIVPLAKVLNDSNDAARAASAYALGQTRSPLAETSLLNALQLEKSSRCISMILEALGKCGSVNALNSLLDYDTHQDPEALLGQARGLYRFGLRNIHNQRCISLAFSLIEQTRSVDAQRIAAHFLSRANVILTPIYETLLLLYDNTDDLFARMAIVGSMGKAKHPSILERLKTIACSSLDYRIKVNAVRALGSFEYPVIKDTFFKLLSGPESNVAITVSEYFQARGNSSDASLYFKTAKQLKQWRVRANMYGAAITFSATDIQKEEISKWITHVYSLSKNTYERVALVTALTGDTRNHYILENIAFSGDSIAIPIRSAAISSLANMCAASAGLGDEKLLKTFSTIFKKAVESGDLSLITPAASILYDPQINLKRFITDSTFLSEALKKCKLPRDLEAWQELTRAVNYFEGRGDLPVVSPFVNRPIDWELVKSISPRQKVLLKTTKGDIVIELMVNDAPGSVSNFIRLIKENFYKHSTFHRVVPNFVIQYGCPRGDGSGGPDYTIGSEFGPLYYSEGTVGMASSGKDTEGSQWFITHSFSPHLDGQYSIFGRVISGMGVVHRIGIGDCISLFKIL